jgi:hypothetical protein
MGLFFPRQPEKIGGGEKGGQKQYRLNLKLHFPGTDFSPGTPAESFKEYAVIAIGLYIALKLNGNSFPIQLKAGQYSGNHFPN